MDYVERHNKRKGHDDKNILIHGSLAYLNVEQPKQREPEVDGDIELSLKTVDTNGYRKLTSLIPDALLSETSPKVHNYDTVNGNHDKDFHVIIVFNRQ